MMQEAVFYPPRQRGLAFHLAAIAVFVIAGGLTLVLAGRVREGPTFLIYLLIFLILVFPIPFLAYRGYALVRSAYVLEREGIRLQWGFRAEDIPMPDVKWVNRARDLNRAPPLPVFRWPGALIGRRHATGFGPIEYIAAEAADLILISTPERIYAISPEDPEAFLQTFNELTELGSLAPLLAQSIHPRFILARIWSDPIARYILLSGILLTSSLIVWVAQIASSPTNISLGFTPAGDPSGPIPAFRLSLLPIINTTFFLSDLLLGAVFYRRAQTQILAYLLWVAGALTSALFLVALRLSLWSGR